MSDSHQRPKGCPEDAVRIWDLKDIVENVKPEDFAEFSDDLKSYIDTISLFRNATKLCGAKFDYPPMWWKADGKKETHITITKKEEANNGS